MQYDYERSIVLANNSFRALIMAAMRVADTDNSKKMQRAWPDIWKEMTERYTMPGEVLPPEGDFEDPPISWLMK